MIVTAFPRAAGTIHCMRLAESLGLRFADEALETDQNKWKEENRKYSVHEAYGGQAAPALPTRKEVIAHPSKFVILSHSPSLKLLNYTSLFVVRQDLNQMLESWVDLYSRVNVSRADSEKRFLNNVLNNVRRISEYLVSNPSAKVLKAETLYTFTKRPTRLKFRLLTQDIVDEVYRRFP